jgi:predicted SAM-dependent methyltransferase
MFDMVIAINGPFYYLLLVEERIQALKNVFDSLKPGGIVFLDLANFIFYLANYNPGKSRHYTQISDRKTPLSARSFVRSVISKLRLIILI